MQTLFDEAVEAVGQDYLDREAKLRSADPALLRANVGHEDPVGRHLAEVLVHWVETSPKDNQAALDYLDSVGGYFGKTPAGEPDPSGVESYLTLHFKERVTGLLALRLAKARGWPEWRTHGVLLYLHTHKAPSFTGPLARFAAETADPKAREFAVNLLRASGDPSLRGKLAWEQARAAKAKRPYPAALISLEKAAP